MLVRHAHGSERKGEKAMTTEKNAPLGVSFLDMQAYVGITKHTGGFEATNELLALCHIEDAHEVLNVGCGIGVGSAYIAKKYNCHVVGVDISEKMIEWSRKRAKEERVEDRVEFRTADVLDLPFEVDRFDIVFCESVLIFVEDKAQATSPEMVAQVKDAIGPFIPTIETWQALWEASGLQERVVKSCQVDARTEVKSRIQWIGWQWLLRAWGRALRLYITNPAIRQSIKEMFDVPSEVFQYAGYGLFVGRK
jgi:SAM-dependent methyltransferase